MFNLKEKYGYSKATLFYDYAKSLAILRENYMRHRPVAHSGIPGLIDDAIEDLIKQVQVVDSKTTSGTYTI